VIKALIKGMKFNDPSVVTKTRAYYDDKRQATQRQVNDDDDEGDDTNSNNNSKDEVPLAKRRRQQNISIQSSTTRILTTTTTTTTTKMKPHHNMSFDQLLEYTKTNSGSDFSEVPLVEIISKYDISNLTTQPIMTSYQGDVLYSKITPRMALNKGIKSVPPHNILLLNQQVIFIIPQVQINTCHRKGSSSQPQLRQGLIIRFNILDQTLDKQIRTWCRRFLYLWRNQVANLADVASVVVKDTSPKELNVNVDDSAPLNPALGPTTDVLNSGFSRDYPSAGDDDDDDDDNDKYDFDDWELTCGTKNPQHVITFHNPLSKTFWPYDVASMVVRFSTIRPGMTPTTATKPSPYFTIMFAEKLNI
jgi:hypothetical protein